MKTHLNLKRGEILLARKLNFERDATLLQTESEQVLVIDHEHASGAFSWSRIPFWHMVSLS